MARCRPDLALPQRGSNFQPLTDKITLAQGQAQGDQYFSEGGTSQLPGVAFNSVMTPISEDAAPPVVSASHQQWSLLHSSGCSTASMAATPGSWCCTTARSLRRFVLRLYRAYTSANGRWKGELVNHEHSPSQGERPVFGGYEVGIGFSGTYADRRGREATALAGKRIRFSVVLKKRTPELIPARSPGAARQ